MIKKMKLARKLSFQAADFLMWKYDKFGGIMYEWISNRKYQNINLTKDRAWYFVK